VMKPKGKSRDTRTWDNLHYADKADILQFLHSVDWPFRSPMLLVWVHANDQHWWISWKIICSFLSNDRYGPDWSFMHLFHTQVCIQWSNTPRETRCTDVWSTTALESLINYLWRTCILKTGEEAVVGLYSTGIN